MPDLRTPLGKARGLGAAKSGTEHFIGMRASSIALALMSIWFMISAAFSLDKNYESAIAWLREPINAVLMILFVLTSLYHMGLGMQVIVEDYIHKQSTKAVLLMANAFLWMGLAAASLYAIVRIGLTGS